LGVVPTELWKLLNASSTFTQEIKIAAPRVANINPFSPYIALANANAIYELKRMLACNMDVPVGLSTRLIKLIIKANTETANKEKPSTQVCRRQAKNHRLEIV